MIPFFRDNNNNNNKENSRGKSSIRLHAPFTRPRIVIPEKKDYRWPVTTVYQYLSRYRSPAQSESDESTVPFSNYFYAIILSNRDRFYSKERKKRNKAIDPLLSSACTRFVLKTRKNERVRFFPSKLRRKSIHLPSSIDERNIIFFFLLFFFFYMENWRRTETDVLRRLIGIYRRSRHDFTMESCSLFVAGAKLAAIKSFRGVLRVGRS